MGCITCEFRWLFHWRRRHFRRRQRFFDNRGIIISYYNLINKIRTRLIIIWRIMLFHCLPIFAWDPFIHGDLRTLDWFISKSIISLWFFFLSMSRVPCLHSSLTDNTLSKCQFYFVVLRSTHVHDTPAKAKKMWQKI